jgi:hypothetical protein
VFNYKNAIEDKKALNDWNAFPTATYQFFSYMNSLAFLVQLSDLVGIEFQCDNGFHGVVWHSHGVGGNLPPHFD